MKKLIRSEKILYIIIAVAFLGAFLAVYLKTEQKLDTIRKAEPVVIHDVTTKKDEEEERTVYVTPSGKKYHLDGCDYLSEKRMAVSLKDALSSEFEACAYCQP